VVGVGEETFHFHHMDERLPDWVLELVPDALGWRPVQSIFVDDQRGAPHRVAITLTNGHTVEYINAQFAEFYNVEPPYERRNKRE